MAKRAKQAGPYTVIWQGSMGFSRSEPHDTLFMAQEERDEKIAGWQRQGYQQVKEGAYFYSNGQYWKSVKIVDGNDQFVKGA